MNTHVVNATPRGYIDGMIEQLPIALDAPEKRDDNPYWPAGANMGAPGPAMSLPLLNDGAGGCACCAAAPSPTPHFGTIVERTTSPATTSSYQVSGMNCGHCVNAVSSELQHIDAVVDVAVDLRPGGASIVTVTSTAPLEHDAVVAALAEAGDYRIVGG